MLGQALVRHVINGIDRDAKKSYHLLSTNYTGIEVLRTGVERANVARELTSGEPAVPIINRLRSR